MEETRTTCAVEATNGALSNGFPSNANLFNFINYISDKELTYSIRLRNMFDRMVVVKKKRASSKADSEAIRKASNFLQAGTFTVDEFLEHIAKMKRQKINALKRTISDDSDSDEDSVVSSEPVQSTSQMNKRQRPDSCEVCDTNSKNVVFLPCAHLVVCSECYGKKKDQKCNSCEALITSHIVIRP